MPTIMRVMGVGEGYEQRKMRGDSKAKIINKNKDFFRLMKFVFCLRGLHANLIGMLARN